MSQWICLSRLWCRITNIAETCINKAILKWEYRLAIKSKKNIQKLTMDFYNRIGMNHLSNITNELVFSSTKGDQKLVVSEHFKMIRFGKLNRESAMKGIYINKLQTYRKYKHTILIEPNFITSLSKCQSFWFGQVPLSYCSSQNRNWNIY